MVALGRICLLAGLITAMPAFAQSGLRLPERGEPGLDPSFARGWLAPEYDRFGFAPYQWRDAYGFAPTPRMRWSYAFGERASLSMSYASLRDSDLEHTLLSGDSDYEWGQFLVDHGVLDRASYEAQNRTYYGQYVAGSLDIHEYLGFALRPLAAHAPEDLRRWHAEFMRLRILPMIHPPARALVRR